MLLVTITKNPPGLRDLETYHEIEAVPEMFARSSTKELRVRRKHLILLLGPFDHLECPAPATVLDLLPLYLFVYFACYGVNMRNNPSQSRLILIKDRQRKTLTIRIYHNWVG